MKKQSKVEKELDDWYCRQPFDNVEKITGVDIWGVIDETEKRDYEKELEEALDTARVEWNRMTLSEKKAWRKKIGDSW